MDEAISHNMIVKEEDIYKSLSSKNFGPTFEWFVCTVCRSQLGSIAYWGVKVKGLSPDYDVILLRENQLGYIECKTGNFSNISEGEVHNFLSRVNQLAPKFSIFLVDGISRGNLAKIADYALSDSTVYRVEVPGVSHTDLKCHSEEYNNFIRLVPINTFFVSVGDSIEATLREVYQFLTQVCDPITYAENFSAKKKFGLTES